MSTSIITQQWKILLLQELTAKTNIGNPMQISVAAGKARADINLE